MWGYWYIAKRSCLNRPVVSLETPLVLEQKPCSRRQGFCSTADGVTSNPIGIPNQLMLMRLSYPQLGRVLFTAPSPYRNVARPGLADRRAITSQFWSIMGGGRICTEDISKNKTPFHLYLTKVLPKVKKES